MEQVTEFLERVFAGILFCAACTWLFLAAGKYQAILKGIESVGYEVWYAR